ncbi:MAG: hypothetical protein LQ338_003032 [Usnochroma carphineum]|nr:MAG: hypothetical protein LQ338_003032 [Usnochroma carphineum]
MPSLRARTSPLKFFASASTPKPRDRRDSHQEWEKEYLHNLRSKQPARPSGARPPPGRIPNSDEPTDVTPPRTASALSFRPLLPSRQTSPSRVYEPEFCSSALLQRRESPLASSLALTAAEQSHPLDQVDTSAVRGGPLAQVHPEATGLSDVSAATRRSSGVYRERGQRLVEKEEARMLREALEKVDLKGETRLHSAAQAEASELVWNHQRAGILRQDLDAPYVYKQRLWSTTHGRSQNDAPVATRAKPEENHGWVKRPVREDSKVEHSDGDKAYVSEVPTADRQHHAPQGRLESVGYSQGGATTEAVDGLVDHPEKTESQPTEGHALWDSPQKKAYRNLSFSVPQFKSHSRRRSSGSRTRTASGSLFRNPDDKIYEEPEEIKQDANTLKLSTGADSAPLGSTTSNPASRMQATTQLNDRSLTDPTESKGQYSRTEIYRNPPSQSRNPSYLQNEDIPAPSEQAKDGHLQTGELRTKGGVEIRSNQIRAATSRRLRDRSPKLPSPTVVSNAKGRPIVSFDKNWTPSETDLKLQGSSPQRPSIQGEACPAPAAARSRPPLLESTASAPAIPTINVTQSPSIQIDEAPPEPSTSACAVPAISISAEETSSTSVAGKPKSSRPLPTPSRKTVPQPSGRPIPHHSFTSPVHSSVLHWSPAQRRATAQCAGCALPISGRIVRASSQRFHPECFTCLQCSEQLECVAFYPEPDEFRNERIARIRARADGAEVPDEAGKTWEDDGDEGLRFYCHLDFHEKFSPRCRSCKTPIEGEVVVACGGEWHVGHFFCAQCGDPFDQKTPFVEKGGYAWCVGCHTNRFSGKCRGCKKPVVDLVVRALGGEWHESCFCCKVRLPVSLILASMHYESMLISLKQECGGPFEDGRFFTRGDNEVPVCVKCEQRRLKA